MTAFHLILSTLNSATLYEPYNTWHLCALLVIATIGLLIATQTQLRSCHRSVCVTLCSISLVSLVLSCCLYHSWPFHICHVSAWLVMPLALLKRIIPCKRFLLLISGWAALIALCVPGGELALHVSLIKYLVFFGLHAAIVWSTIYVFCHDRPTLNLQAILSALRWPAN